MVSWNTFSAACTGSAASPGPSDAFCEVPLVVRVPLASEVEVVLACDSLPLEFELSCFDSEP